MDHLEHARLGVAASENGADSQRGFATIFKTNREAARMRPACRVYPPSLPGLTRQSILFVKNSYEEDGPAGQARG
jgi:hypothetical protein